MALAEAILRPAPFGAPLPPLLAAPQALMLPSAFWATKAERLEKTCV